MEGRAGRSLAEHDIDRLAAMNVLRRTGNPDLFQVDPGILHLGVRLLDVPIALETIIAARELMLEHSRAAARELSRLFRDEVWQPDRPEAMKSLSAHMQPLVVQALVTAFQRSLREELRAGTWESQAADPQHAP